MRSLTCPRSRSVWRSSTCRVEESAPKMQEVVWNQAEAFVVRREGRSLGSGGSWRSWSALQEVQEQQQGRRYGKQLHRIRRTGREMGERMRFGRGGGAQGRETGEREWIVA